MTNPPKNDTWSKPNEFSAVETSMCDDAIYEFLKLFVVVFCVFVVFFLLFSSDFFQRQQKMFVIIK